jgi:ABC-type Fe3+-hydroxamate transport system substrate-binding protein
MDSHSEQAKEFSSPVRVIDQTGRTIELPHPSARTAVLFPQAMGGILVLGLATDTIVGIPNFMLKWTPEKCPDFIRKVAPGLAGVADIGYPGKVNTETLLMLKPDLIIGPVHLMKASDAIRALGFSVVSVKAGFGSISDWHEAISIIAALHGVEDRLETYKSTCSRIVGLADKVGSIEKSRQVSAVFITSFMGKMQAGGSRTSMAFDILTRAGARCPASDLSGAGQISLESLYLWNPDHIFLGETSVPSECRNDPCRAIVSMIPGTDKLKAVISGNVHVVPQDDPECWFSSWFQPANHPLGILWAASLMYPEHLKSLDINAIAEKFFSDVYGYSTYDSSNSTSTDGSIGAEGSIGADGSISGNGMSKNEQETMKK